MAVQDTERVNLLLKAGRKAARAGDTATANEKFRKAAELSPYDERVWVALLEVVIDPEDQRVCVENILRINPKNAKARRLQPSPPPAPVPKPVPAPRVDSQWEAERRFARQEKARMARRRSWRSLRSGIGLGILAGLVGALIGSALSAVIYGLGFYAAQVDQFVAPLRSLLTP